MNSVKLILIATVSLVLAACDTNDSDRTVTEKDTGLDAQQQAGEKLDKLTDAVKAKAEKAVAALKIDASSFDSFKASLAGMKGQLSGVDQSRLTDALGALATQTTDQKEGLMGAAKSMMSGKSVEETVFEAVGEKLDGLTFDDILSLTKN